MPRTANSFTITTGDKKMNLDSAGTAKALFTVTNTSAQALRGRLLTRPSDPAKPEWFSIVGESVRDFALNASEQVVVQLDVPPGTPPASYSFRLDAVSEVDPDEDFTEGPSVAFEVEAHPTEEEEISVVDSRHRRRGRPTYHHRRRGLPAPQGSRLQGDDRLVRNRSDPGHVALGRRHRPGVVHGSGGHLVAAAKTSRAK